MNAIQITLSVVQLIASLVIIAVVLFQSGRRAGISGAISGGAETFFGKSKGRTIEAKLAKWTTLVAALFIVLTVALNIVANIGQ